MIYNYHAKIGVEYIKLSRNLLGGSRKSRNLENIVKKSQ